MTIEEALEKNSSAQNALLLERVYLRRLQQSVMQAKIFNKQSMGNAPLSLSWLVPRQRNDLRKKIRQTWQTRTTGKTTQAFKKIESEKLSQHDSPENRQSVGDVEFRTDRAPSLTGSSQSLSPARKARTQVEDPDDPSWPNRSWALAFNRLKKDGAVQREDLLWALELTGHHQPNSVWAKEVLGSTTHAKTVNKEQFIAFVEGYDARHRMYLEEQFRKADFDNSGTVSVLELSSLLRSSGVTPLPEVLDDLLMELKVLEKNGENVLYFEEYCRVLEILKDRSGFTSRETDEYQALFNRFSKNSGKVDATQLEGVFGWLHYTFDEEKAYEMVNDVDRCGKLNFREFLVVMRRQRESDIQNIGLIFAECDRDHNGTLEQSEIPGVFAALGYCLSPSVLEEVLAEVNLMEKTHMVFEDLWRLVKCFRAREGFLKSEHDDFRRAYEKFDADQSGGISVLELGAVLRWLGYHSNVEMQQDLVEEIDVDNTGQLDFPEFVKLMRKYRESEMRTLQRAFAVHDNASTGKIRAGEIRSVLLALGYTPSASQIKELEGFVGGHSAKLDLSGFSLLVERYRESSREQLRLYHGYTDKEVKKIQKVFKSFHPDKNGKVESQHLAELLEEVFPTATKRAIEMIIVAVDEDHDGAIDFQEFLALMRKFQDNKDEQIVAKTEKAVHNCGFTRKEVHEFRRVFHHLDTDESGELSLKEIQQLLSYIVPVSDHVAHQIGKLLDSDHADFSDFLMLMRKMQDQNLGNINDITSEVAHH